MIAVAHELGSLDTNQADWTMLAEVQAALGASQYTAIRRLQASVSSGVVEITGRVPSFYMKAMAQAAVLNLYAGSVVRNLVEVK